jgi:hypothetical protein
VNAIKSKTDRGALHMKRPVSSQRSPGFVAGPRGQRGMTTLVIGVLLLVILTVMSLYAAQVGVFEQRIAANEVRAKRSFHAAEAGVHHGLEILKANTVNIVSERSTGPIIGWMNPLNPRWQRCQSTDTTFPCGGEPDPARRSQLYRYCWDTTQGAGSQGCSAGEYASPGLSREDPRLWFPVDSAGVFGDAAGSHRVGALLCILEKNSDPAILSRCNPNFEDKDEVVLNFVSAGQAPAAVGGMEGLSVVKQWVGSYRLLNSPPKAPIIAAGNVFPAGNFQIVTNPNGGGFGIPLSVWSNTDVAINASSAASCHIGSFLASAAAGDIEIVDGATLCDDCDCPDTRDGIDRSLTLKSTGSCTPRPEDPYFCVEEGIDVVDGNGADGGPTPAETNFPNDLFQYIFGISSNDWRDIEQAARTSNQYVNAANRATVCARFNETASGLWWMDGATCPMGSEIGSPLEPVLLVVKNSRLTLNGRFRFFGVIYAHCTPNEADPDHPDGGEAGCNPDIKLNGGGLLYGALLADSDVDLGAGSFKSIYNEDVLQNLSNSNAFVRFGYVPGTWSDADSY